MAKGKNDLILRDRLQFDVSATGDVITVYGRIDLSDYVNVVSLEGLSIKEVRYQIRDTTTDYTGVLDPTLLAGTGDYANIKLYATTSAYESAVDVGIASPNVLSVVEMTTTMRPPGGTGDAPPTFINAWTEWSTPDLHPAGYPIVTDLLIGIAADNCVALGDKTIEIDVMLIAEPIKLSKDDLNDMLIQAQDL